MNKETFNKVAQIAEEMKLLESINKQIKNATLSFIGDNYYDAIIPPKRKSIIQDILLRHEAEIRKEIKDRYNDLKNQIEEL